jgi:hypothetical protein
LQFENLHCALPLLAQPRLNYKSGAKFYLF